MPTVHVSVPATTANLGPGFDCIGAALTLANRFEFTRLADSDSDEEQDRLRIEASGEGADKITTDSSNFVYQAFCKLFNHLGQPVPPVQIKIDADVPLSRGLGSSATAIVGGLVGANVLAGKPLDEEAIAALATEIEGHPDNVVPALLGGCRLAASTPAGSDHPWEICDLPWHDTIIPIVAIPDFELSTSEARSVLPERYSRAEAVFNTAHLGLLIRAVGTGNPAYLKAALQDKIHQPYRKQLIKGFDAVQAAALEAGAHGLVISGAGPTLLALGSDETVDAIAQAMETAWKREGVTARIKPLRIDTQGTTVE